MVGDPAAPVEELPESKVGLCVKVVFTVSYTVEKLVKVMVDG